MKNKSLLLLKIQLLGQLRGTRAQRGKGLMAAAFVVLGIVFAAYSFILAYGLGSIGLAHVVPSYGVAVIGIVTLFFTALKANGVLFAYRDYDMLMALPIKTDAVIASRFLTMYLMNLLFTVLIMLPMGVGYAVCVSPGALFYLIWGVGMLISPLIPTTVATLLGAAIIFLTSRFRHANILATILSIICVCGVVVLSFGLGGLEEQGIEMTQLSGLGEMMVDQINRLYPPAGLFERAVNTFDMGAFLIFSGVSVGWYLIFIKLVSIKYKSMNTGLMTYHTRSDYKLTSLRTSSPLMAVCKKEAKRFFTCPIYTMNMGIGVILMLLFAVACAVMGVEKIETMINMPGMAAVIAKILPFLLTMLQCMSCTTSVSLSLEGRNLWILKSLPVKKEVVYNGKILFNLLLIIPAGLAASLILALRFPMTPLNTAMLFFMPAVSSIFVSVLGMYINIKLPNYEWTNEVEVVKQSFSAMAGIFGGMLIGLIPMLIILILQGIFAEIFAIIILVGEGVLAYLLYRHVMKLDF